jgi:hypothetical protein
MNDMISRIIKDKRKFTYILIFISALILFSIYLYALTRPGVRYKDAFLYQQADGSFVGKDNYFDYRMQLQDTENGTAISLSIEDETRNYLVVLGKTDDSVVVYENDTLLFEGTEWGNSGMLLDQNGELVFGVTVSANSHRPVAEEQFPNFIQLYRIATMDELDLRGSVECVFLILFFGLYIIIDVCFPEFFFRARYFLAFDLKNAEPSDGYYVGQLIGRIVCGVAIVVCAIISFYPQ